MNAAELLQKSQAGRETRALKNAVGNLSKPDIHFGGESRYAYKGWIPTLIPFIQKSSGIYDAMADSLGRLPSVIQVPANTVKAFQILTPKDHPFLLVDIKVAAAQGRLVGDPGVWEDTGSRFQSPYGSGNYGSTTDFVMATRIADATGFITAADFVVDGDASLGNITLTLPNQPGVSRPSFMVKQISATGIVTLSADAGETITDIGAAPALTLNLAGRGTVILQGDGVSNWTVINSSLVYPWIRSLIPNDEMIASALTAVSPGGKSIYGSMANVSGLINTGAGTSVATASSEPHLERIPLSNLQYGGSGKGALKTPILFPKDGILKIEIQNDSEFDYYVNGLVNGYRILG